MTRFAIALALVAATHTPAYASGEARAGIASAGGTSETFAGIGGGYDFDLGDKAFVGVDLGADKVLAPGTEMFVSVGGRVGAKVGGNGRIYASGGMGFCCGGSDPYIGAGYQYRLNPKVYGKIEYRKALSGFGPNIDFVGIGLGVAF
jgi:outer membrane immunogenic protein